MCQIWLRSDRRECNAGMTIAKCTKTAASSNVSNHLSRTPAAWCASGAAHHARHYRNLGRRISLRSYTIVDVIVKNGIFFLKKNRNLPDRGHSLSHRVKSYYIIVTIIVGYCRRKDDGYIGRRMLRMELPGKRKRGRPKRRFMDVVKEDMAEVEVTEEDTVDRNNWRRKIRCGDPCWEKAERRRRRLSVIVDDRNYYYHLLHSTTFISISYTYMFILYFIYVYFNFIWGLHVYFNVMSCLVIHVLAYTPMESNGIHVYFNLIYLLGCMFILISYHVYFNLIV